MDVNNTRVIEDPLLGNGLVATSDLEPGEVIIGISKPYILVVEKAALSKVCSQCLLETEDLKRCASCKVPRYCSTACQTESWRSGHKAECSKLKTLPDVPPTSVRALIQILLAQTASGPVFDPRWKDLKDHMSDLKKMPNWNDIVLQARAGLEFSNYPPNWFEVATALLCRMATNGFRVTLPDSTPVGLCFEPVISIANHSCAPNATITFDGRKILLLALDRIKKDEQIFIAYVDITQLTATRRAELQERYYFTCNCSKCVNDDNPYNTFLKYSQTSSPTLDLFIEPKTLAAAAAVATLSSRTQQLGRELNSPLGAYGGIRMLVEGAKSTTDQTKRLTWLTRALQPFHPLREFKRFAEPPCPSILNELYLYHLDNSSFPSALILLLFIFLNCDVYIHLQPHHPVRVIHLYTIASLLRHIASLPSSTLVKDLKTESRTAVAEVDWISASQAILILVTELGAKSHGKESRFMHKVEQELREVEEVQRLRGNVGQALKHWCVRGNDAVEGREYANKLFGGLRWLGGNVCAFEVLNQGLSLTELDNGLDEYDY